METRAGSINLVILSCRIDHHLPWPGLPQRSAQLGNGLSAAVVRQRHEGRDVRQHGLYAFCQALKSTALPLRADS